VEAGADVVRPASGGLYFPDEARRPLTGAAEAGRRSETGMSVAKEMGECQSSASNSRRSALVGSIAND
jgi:hypothetical protein